MQKLRSILSSKLFQWAAVVIILALAVTLRDRWWPRVNSLVDQWTGSKASEDGETHDEHADHDAHPAPPTGPAPAFIDLSPEAIKNLGLTSEQMRPVVLTTYRKTISVPALIVERPGQTLLQVSTPMTGVVTEVAAIEGSSVEPGQLLFRIRLTHEDLVQTQTEFVRALGELGVEEREIKRLEAVSESGAISGKSLLEHRYAKEKLEALLQAQREALRLHGLSVRQVDQVAKERRLLSELSITVPSTERGTNELRLTDGTGPQSIVMVAGYQVSDAPNAPAAPTNATPPLAIESLQVQRGQSIEQGGKLCVLADYSHLYVEGSAFEQDIEAINKAVSQAWKIAALFPGGQRIEELPLAFVASEVDASSRTLKFYVDIQNEVLRDTKNASGQRFITWKHKPGQRLQLQVPVEEWPKQIVLPLDAVAQEGVDSFVFQRKGKQRFDRIAVHVLHRDQSSVVVANDGSLFPGDVVALRSAHQIQMAIKNKSGGAIDPHAGHTH